MSESSEHFDDPALKGALRKACGKPSAPAGLARKLEKLASGESPAGSARPRRISWGLVAAAAIVLIGIGLAWMVNQPEKGQPLPANVLSGVTATHDRCIGKSHQAFKGDFATIGSAMANQLKRPVIATSLGGDWAFKGAANCGVGSDRAAHLMYDRGAEHISIFSLPVSSCGAPEGTLYYSADASHPCAGFVHKGALFCVTGTSDTGRLPLKRVIQIREQLRTVPPATPSVIQHATTELLVPTGSCGTHTALAHSK